MFEKLEKLLEKAKEEGASDQDIKDIRRYFKMTTDWNPTRKIPTDEERKRKRRAQKISRRLNRGKMKGQKCHKGQKFNMMR